MDGVNLVVMTEEQLNGILGKLDLIQQKLDEAEEHSKGKKMTPEEATEYLGLKNRETLYKWVRESKIPHIRVGSLIFFDSKELDAWSYRPATAEV